MYLEEVKLSSRLKKIEEKCFSDCYSLSSIEIPRQVKHIGVNAFFGCKALTTVLLPEGLEVIGDCAFDSCCNLKEITLPESLNTLGKNVFYSNHALHEINLPKNIATISEYLFTNSKGLRDLVIPIHINEVQVGAFAYSSVSTVFFPDSIQSCGDRVFSMCENLKRVNVPPMLDLRRMSIPDGVSVIRRGIGLRVSYTKKFFGFGNEAVGRRLAFLIHLCFYRLESLGQVMPNEMINMILTFLDIQIIPSAQAVSSSPRESCSILEPRTHQVGATRIVRNDGKVVELVDWVGMLDSKLPVYDIKEEFFDAECGL